MEKIDEIFEMLKNYEAKKLIEAGFYVVSFGRYGDYKVQGSFKDTKISLEDIKSIVRSTVTKEGNKFYVIRKEIDKLELCITLHD